MNEKLASIKNYMTSPLLVTADTTCERLIALFKQYPEQECAIVIDSLNLPISIIMQNHLFMKLSQRYSVDLYHKKPVIDVYNELPLVIELHSAPEQCIDKALSRPIQQRYDCVVVVNEQRVAGILTMTNILELSNALQRLAKQEQKNLIQSASICVSNIHTEMKQVEEEVHTQLQQFNQMSDFTQNGKLQLQKLLNSFSLSITNMQMQHEQMTTLDKSSKELYNITSLVNELAEQTKILALNASIEAVKAGENGKTFKVVAQQLMELVTKTKTSVVRIAEVIEQMLQLIETKGVISQRSISLADAGIMTVNETEEIFKAIFEGIGTHRLQLQHILQQADQAVMLSYATQEELSRLERYFL